MATRKTTTAATAAQDDEERRMLAFDACSEIEALVRMLLRDRDTDDRMFEIVLGTSLRRIKAVNSVIASVTGGDGTRTALEMREVVHGEEVEA